MFHRKEDTFSLDDNLSERISDCILTPHEQLFSYIMARTSYIRWNDDYDRFILDQYA
jgi:hypothetical protein